MNPKQRFETLLQPAVQGSQLLSLSFALSQQLVSLQLSHFAVRDIEGGTADAARIPALVSEDAGPAAEPPHGAVRPEDAVLHLVAGAVLHSLVDTGGDVIV